MPVINQASGKGWMMYHGDAVEIMRNIPDNSLHYGIWSPPFDSLYTFSDDPRDLSNCTDSETFFRHYDFLCAEITRALMPGRLVTIHVMDLPTSKNRDGFIGLRDFPGEIIRAHQRAGLIYHSRVCIWKNPVAAMQRTKSIGLLHKQVVKDSALSRQAVADYMVTLRKPGDNDEPISGGFVAFHGDDYEMAAEDPQRVGGHVADSYSVKVWQRYASPVWMDIVQSDVLSHRAAREVEDERHISPMQLTPIRRCLQLWSNPGDVVFSPFAGIGSELYCALEMGRKGVGAELKQSYYEQAVANLRSVEARPAAHPMFGDAA